MNGIITIDLLRKFLEKLRIELKTINYTYYCGLGSVYNSAITNANKYNTSTTIEFTASDNNLFLIYPSDKNPTLTMSGFLIPMQSDGTTTIDNTTYSIFKSKNKYTGTFKIEIK